MGSSLVAVTYESNLLKRDCTHESDYVPLLKNNNSSESYYAPLL